MSAQSTKNRVVICYHFFAHYRQPIVDHLISHGESEYFFFASSSDPSSNNVKSYSELPLNRFHNLACKELLGVILVQPGALSIPFQSDMKAVIFLGNMYMPFTWLAAVICRLRGIRVLFWTHGWLRPEYGLKAKLRCLFYRLADNLLVYEHNAKCIAIQSGFNPDSVHVVYNSLDYVKQSALYENLKQQPELLSDAASALFGNRDNVVICSSRLTANRKIDQLIDAIAILKTQGKSCNLLVVGDGDLKSTLKLQAQKQNVNAAFVGACYDEMVLARYFMMSAVTVSPGPIGLMTIHSFSFGTPVIADDDSANQKPEWGAILPGINGSYFEKDNVSALANEISYWLERQYDREQISSSCRKVVDSAYNPTYQTLVIDRAVNGKPANDLLRAAD